MTDNFNGDTPHLIQCIEALLELDAAKALVPHGIGGHARTLLTAAACRLAASGDMRNSSAEGEIFLARSSASGDYRRVSERWAATHVAAPLSTPSSAEGAASPEPSALAEIDRLRRVIDSMKQTAETAGVGGDEQMRREALEEISNEGLEALTNTAPLYPAASPEPIEPCPRGKLQKPDKSCINRNQCWEPCGKLGNSMEHARVSASPEPATVMTTPTDPQAAFVEKSMELAKTCESEFAALDSPLFDRSSLRAARAALYAHLSAPPTIKESSMVAPQAWRGYLDAGDAGRDGEQWLTEQIPADATAQSWSIERMQFEYGKSGADGHVAVLWERRAPHAAYMVLRDGLNHSRLLMWTGGTPASPSPQGAESLLRRTIKQFDRWQEKYGTWQPDWLPPAGDVRLAEDIAEYLSDAAAPPPTTAAIRMALEALELASNGLQWYQNMGDYALLDLPCKPRHSPKRQAGFLSWGLLCVVVAAIAYIELADAVPILPNPLVSEISKPTGDKSIVVGEMPENMKGVFGGNEFKINVFQAKSHREEISWSEYASHAFFERGVERGRLPEERLAGLDGVAQAQVFGRYFSEIEKRNAQMGLFFSRKERSLRDDANILYQDIGAQFLRRVGLHVGDGLFGSIGGLLGNCQGIFGFAGLTSSRLLRISGEPFSLSIQECGVERQAKSHDDQRRSEVDQPPFARRVIVALLGFIGGFYLYDRGLSYVYNERRRLGSALICIGLLLLLSSLGLWLASGFRWTWNWWF